MNSAGRDSLAPPLEDVTLEEWNKTIGRTSLQCFFAAARPFITWGRRAGAVSSTWARPRPVSPPVRATVPTAPRSTACWAFSKNILLDGQRKGIGVTVLNPSHVKTPMTEIIDKGLYDGNLKAYTTAGSMRRRSRKAFTPPASMSRTWVAGALCGNPHAGRYHPHHLALSHAQDPPLRDGSLRR